MRATIQASQVSGSISNIVKQLQVILSKQPGVAALLAVTIGPTLLTRTNSIVSVRIGSAVSITPSAAYKAPTYSYKVQIINPLMKRLVVYVTIIEKIDHSAQKFKIEIITSLYSARPAEYADIFVFYD